MSGAASPPSGPLELPGESEMRDEEPGIMRWTKKYRAHLTKMRIRAWAISLSRRKGAALCKRLLSDKGTR